MIRRGWTRRVKKSFYPPLPRPTRGRWLQEGLFYPSMSHVNTSHTLFHLILIKTLGNKHSFPNFADGKTEIQSLNDLPKVLQPGGWNLRA